MQFHYFYSLPVRMHYVEGNTTRRQDYRQVHFGQFKWKRPLGRRRRKEQGSIKISLREIGRKNMDRNHLVRNKEQWKAFLNTVMTFGFHKQQGIY